MVTSFDARRDFTVSTSPKAARTAEDKSLQLQREEVMQKVSDMRKTSQSMKIFQIDELLVELESKKKLYPVFNNMRRSEIENITSTRARNVYALKMQYMRLINLIADLKLAKRIQEDIIEAIPQSWEMQNDATSIDNALDHSNITDIVGQEQTSIDMSSASLSGTDQLQDNNVFARPVLVFSSSGTTWDLEEIPVWDRVTRDPLVRSRLRNWSYLRAKMNVKITVTGTPFHMGRIFAGYYPYHYKNTMLVKWKALITDNASRKKPFLTYFSQDKHFVVMNVNENKPVTMQLPFICYKTKCSLFNDQLPIAADTPFNDLEEIYDHPVLEIGSSYAALKFEVIKWLNAILS